MNLTVYLGTDMLGISPTLASAFLHDGGPPFENETIDCNSGFGDTPYDQGINRFLRRSRACANNAPALTAILNSFERSKQSYLTNQLDTLCENLGILTPPLCPRSRDERNDADTELASISINALLLRYLVDDINASLRSAYYKSDLKSIKLNYRIRVATAPVISAALLANPSRRGIFIVSADEYRQISTAVTTLGIKQDFSFGKGKSDNDPALDTNMATGIVPQFLVREGSELDSRLLSAGGLPPRNGSRTLIGPGEVGAFLSQLRGAFLANEKVVGASKLSSLAWLRSKVGASFSSYLRLGCNTDTDAYIPWRANGSNYTWYERLLNSTQLLAPQSFLSFCQSPDFLLDSAAGMQELLDAKPGYASAFHLYTVSKELAMQPNYVASTKGLGNFLAKFRNALSLGRPYLDSIGLSNVSNVNAAVNSQMIVPLSATKVRDFIPAVKMGLKLAGVESTHSFFDGIPTVSATWSSGPDPDLTVPVDFTLSSGAAPDLECGFYLEDGSQQSLGPVNPASFTGNFILPTTAYGLSEIYFIARCKPGVITFREPSMAMDEGDAYRYLKVTVPPRPVSFLVTPPTDGVYFSVSAGGYPLMGIPEGGLLRYDTSAGTRITVTYIHPSACFRNDVSFSLGGCTTGQSCTLTADASWQTSNALFTLTRGTHVPSRVCDR